VVFEVYDPSAWNTIPWIEDFSSYEEGARTGGNHTPWTAVRETGAFYVINGKLAIRDGGSMAYFYTNDIDISDDTVNISLEVEGIGGLDAEGSANDYVEVYKIVDGQEELIFQHSGTFGSTIVQDPNFITCGSDLSVFIKTRTTAENEYYYFDNIKITPNIYKIHTLEISAENGAVSINPEGNNAKVFLDGSELSLTAIPDDGYEFNGWSGDISGSENPVSIVMDSDKGIIAIFTQITNNGKQESIAPRNILEQNYPNPFDAATTIPYYLTEARHVKITVCNVLGQPLVCLADGPQEAGYHEIHWQVRDENGYRPEAGIYFYQMETSDQPIETRRLVLKR
jgi:hypothetical protein